MKIIIAINGHGLRWQRWEVLQPRRCTSNGRRGSDPAAIRPLCKVCAPPPHPAHTLSPLKVLGTGTLVLSGLVDPCCELVL